MTTYGAVRRESLTYRTVEGVPLEARLLLPESAAEPRSAIAYFHPGAWRAGGPTLIHELRHLAMRGMVVAAFGYRLLPDRNRPPRQRTGYAMRYDAADSIGDCVADAQAAIRWLRARADVDASRVVAAGYSSGAHLAAATALLPPVEPIRATCRPDALVLYAGVFDHASSDLSPLHHVRAKAPPALVMCGERDSLAKQSRRFAHSMVDAGNRCDLAMFPGAHNTFMSDFRNRVFASALRRVDEFLTSLGYVDEVRNVDELIADLPNSAPKRRARNSRTVNQSVS